MKSPSFQLSIKNICNHGSKELLHLFLTHISNLSYFLHSRPSHLCQICLDTLGNRKMYCLSCNFIGCIDSAHFKRHIQHSLFWNPYTNHFFCTQCNRLLALEEFLSIFAFRIHHLRPKGLNNLGNTCFLNAVLQVFLNDADVMQMFLADNSLLLKQSCQKRKLMYGEGKNHSLCMTCDFQDLCIKYCSATINSLSPANLLQSLWSCSTSTLAGYMQHDSHEFFISFLNDMHLHFSEDFAADCTCFVHRNWCGQLESIVCCGNCRKDSTTIESFFDISISIGQTNSASLLDLLHKFIASEHITAGQYYCTQCGVYSNECWKRIAVHSAPNYLCIHLKRFTNTEFSLQAPTLLDISPFTAEKNSTSLYLLVAAVCHVGTMESGHYFCILRSGDSWVCADDNVISMIGNALPESALSNAYLLFYKRL